MKIIIVGGGISGCATALHLRHSFASSQQHEIKIYEKHVSRPHLSSLGGEGAAAADSYTLDELSGSTAAVGGGLAVSPNGMRVLRELSVELRDRVVRQGFSVEKFCFRSWRGWVLSCSSAGDRRGEGEEEFAVASSRHGIWKCLVEELGPGVVQYKKVVGVVGAGETGRKVRVVFEGGEEEEADLIIGADGVKSVVKECILSDDKYKPVYNGLLGVGGFVPTPAPKDMLAQKAMAFIFGRNGFFGYAPSSPTSTMWWSTIHQASLPTQNHIAIADLRAQLADRHGNWADPFVRSIIANADVGTVYPTWTVPKLPFWGKDGCILVGDAAHALDPTSGQGSSQALEDTKTLSICLFKYLSQVSADGLTTAEAVDKAGDLYYKVREPRLDAIRERTKKLSSTKRELSLVEEMVTCFFFWMMGKVPSIGKMLIGDVNKELYEWDVHAEIEKVLAKDKQETPVVA